MTGSLQKIVLASAMLAAAVLVGGGDADAARARRAAASVAAFDGTWSVTVFTTAGPCDASYRFPIQIAGGRVFSRDISGVNGRVTARGAVQVAIRQGDRAASGAGRLVGNSGAGRWNGYSSSGRCTGQWQATRS